MKRILGFLIISFLIIPCLEAQTRVDSLLFKLHSNEKDYVFVVAHRGDWRNAPENSLSALERAVDMGVDMVEIDIQQTKDGKFVLMHDRSIDRTTTGQGLVADYTADELKQFLLKGGHGIKTHEQVPTLEEALLFCKDRVLVNIDKGGTYIREIMPVIQQTGAEKQVIIKGRYPVEKVREDYGKRDGMLYMPVVDADKKEAWGEIENFLYNFHPVAIEVCFRTDTFPELARFPEIVRSGSRIWVNTLWDSLCGGHDDELSIKDPDAHWGWILRQGTSLIQTDRPEELIKYLNQKNLRKLAVTCSGK